TVTFISQTADPAVNDGTITRTYRVDDGNGNTIDVFQDIVIDDTQDPTASNPADINVQCLADVPAADPAVVTDEADNCGTPTVTFISQTADPAVNDGTITRTYRVDDGNGNTIDVFQDIVIDDTQDPTVTSCPPDVLSQNTDSGKCYFTFDPNEPVFTDNCSVASITWEMTGATIGSGVGSIGSTQFYPGVTTITFTATDAANNINNSCSYIVEVSDQNSPNIVCPGNLTAHTSNDGIGNCTTTVAVGTPTVSDNCTPVESLEVTWSLSGATTGSGTGPINTAFNAGLTNVTWTVIDVSGNFGGCIQRVTVNDDEAPVISTAAGTLDHTLECSDATGLSAALLEVPSATDNCVTVNINLISDDTVNGSCTNAYVRTRTWNFDDGNGNTSGNYTQTITVIDSTDPVFAGLPAATATVECDAIPAPPTVTASDNCD
ncbi:HYR-like domain-containing protein, partial [Tamlana flava]|uniref:HYR-like domain-containing protein n=1 Tax=Tamlana flava TaxID=3158572 RepID=UPI00351B8012